MKGKLAVLVLVASVCTLTSLAAAATVSYSPAPYGPQAYQADAFSLTGQSGTVSLSSTSTTTADINTANFTVGDSGSFSGSQPLTISYGLTLDGVTHTLTQQATWTITPSQDTFVTVASSAPVLFVTPSGNWNVALDGYSIPANAMTTFTASTPADFTPTPEPGTLLMLGSGVIGLAGVARRKLKI